MEDGFVFLFENISSLNECREPLLCSSLGSGNPQIVPRGPDTSPRAGEAEALMAKKRKADRGLLWAGRQQGCYRQRSSPRYEQAQGVAVREATECGCQRRRGVGGSVVLAVNPLSGANVGTKPQSLSDMLRRCRAHHQRKKWELGASLDSHGPRAIGLLRVNDHVRVHVYFLLPHEPVLPGQRDKGL